MQNQKRFGRFLVVFFIISVVWGSLGAGAEVLAFDVLGTFVNNNKFSIIFDANIASSTVTSTAFTLNGGATAVQSVFAPADEPRLVYGNVSGTLSVGNTINVSSSLWDVSSNANNSTSTLSLMPTVKIAEIRSGTTGNNLDEYILLYNGMDSSWQASGTLNLHVSRPAGDVNVPLSFATTTIPGHGFFLITSASGYSGGISPDATWSTSTDLFAATTTAVYINSSATARATITDKVEWGSAVQFSTSTASSSSFAATLATTTFSAGITLVRKAVAASTANTMKSGGSDSSKGNMYDTRSNSQDFVVLDPSAGQTAIIKNSQSPQEFPFSGGSGDTVPPFVMGSFPGGTPGEMVPTDMQFVGFNLSEPVDLSTIGTSTVSLVVQGQATNLCSSVTYSNMPVGGPPGQCSISGSLTSGTTYVFTIKGASSTPSVTDFAGNVLLQPAGSGMGQHGNANHDYEITFSPQSGFIMTPQVPPVVFGTYPIPGSSGVFTNLSKISVMFSAAMNAASLSGITLMPVSGGGNILNSTSTVQSGDGKSVSIPINTALTASQQYRITVSNTVRNSNNISLPMEYSVTFTAGSGSDSTGPQVIGRLPNVPSGVPVNAIDVHISTDDSLDMSTVSTTTIQVADGIGNTVPGVATYDPMSNEIIWTANNVFQLNTQYTVSLNAASSSTPIKNSSGLPLQDTDGTANNSFQFSFTTANTPDLTGPGVLFTNANGFSLAVTFDEAVKENEAETLSNYSLVSGGSPVTLSTMNGHSVSYDAAKRTAIISGLFLTSGVSFTATVTNVHDLSNNPMGAQNSFTGTVQSAGLNGGQIGPGGGFIDAGNVPNGFSTSTFGFVPQADVRPFNSLAGFTSTYGADIPISTRIPSGGKIVLTFPSTFTLSGAAADSFSPANSDINGPGAGTVAIAGVVGNDTAHTITITTNGATRNEGGDAHDFLHFDISGITNSPVPKSPSNSNGYTVDIKTVDGTTTLDSVTSRPFFITSGSGGGSLTVSIAAAGATAGTMSVYVFSPLTGSLSTSTTAFSTGNATATFSGIPNGMYGLSTDPIITLTGGTFVGRAIPSQISVNTTTSASIALSASGSLASSTVNVHASAAGKKVAIFAGGPSGFIDLAVTTANGTTTNIIYYPADGDYSVGVGPQINKTFMGPPPAPDYVMPRPTQVHVANGVASSPTINFDLVNAGNTITGSVQDSSGKAVANANVFAYSPQGGFGTFGQSGSNGSFSLAVAPGSYKVGASAPGFPSGLEVSVVVDSSGNVFVNGSATASASVVIKLSKPSTKISGKVSDGTNAVQGASVWAYCDPGTSNNSCFGSSGHAEAQTNSNGNYTLYVGNGTWKVGAFIPEYGQQPETSVTVSGSDQDDVNFQPSATGSFKSVSGTVCTGTGSDCTTGTAVSGAFVRIEGTDPNGRFYSNGTVSGSNGTYTFASIPAGSSSSYRVRGRSPQLGEIAPTAAFNVNADNVTSKDLVMGAGRTVSINVASNPSSFDMFMSFTNSNSGMNNFIKFHNNASGTISLPNGSTYKLDIQAPGFGLGKGDISLTSGTASYSTSTGQLDLTSGSDTVVLSVTFPASTAISGAVRDDSNNLVANAWVDVSAPSSGLHFGSQANSSGTYSLALQDGTYTMSGFAPGYVSVVKSLVLSSGTITLGNSTTTSSAVNITINKTSLSISGTITAAGNAAAGAFVKGSLLGGGTSVVSADANGVYSLPVVAGTWTISAAAEGYQGQNYSSNPVVIGASSVSGVNVNLTTKANLASPLVQPITPSQGGSIKNSSGTLDISVPANALGSSANTGQFKVNETSQLVSTATARPIGFGQDIKAYDSSNNQINNLNSNITITLEVASSSFSGNSITSTSTAGKVKLGYFDESLGDWVSIASTVEYRDGNDVPVTPNVTLSNVDHLSVSGAVSHLTKFGTITVTDSVAPATPTGVSTAAGASSITITWTAPTTSSDGTTLSDFMEYEIYRDTSESGNFTTQVNTSQVTSATFTDATVTVGADYYYKVSAVDTSGNESSKSSVSPGRSTTAVGTVQVASAPTSVPASSSAPTSGSSVASASAPAASATPTTNAPVAIAAEASAAAIPALPAPAISAIFQTSLSLNSKGKNVERLQQILAQDKDIYPEGLVTGYFGAMTKKAIQRFQVKYDIASSGPGYGVLGPKTRAKMKEIFGEESSSPAGLTPVQTEMTAQPQAASVAQPAAASRAEVEQKIQQLQEQLVLLLQELSNMLQAQAKGN